ncbi:hypothetical protein NKR23_g11733 [Pleurostoma richardsiae]|uniref:Uncharacterized protein n=1 Tax=Pleurostoma richardsiae TaxID=41990 RepID=A0AA38VGI0_9PEZI|nr:hypothetical protein NKR23_g11733 [Pleurostoma richardsiae]
MALFPLPLSLATPVSTGPGNVASVTSFSAAAQGNGTSSWVFSVIFTDHPVPTRCTLIRSCPADDLCGDNGTMQPCDDSAVFAGWLKPDDSHALLGIALLRDEDAAELAVHNVRYSQLEWKEKFGGFVQVYAGPNHFIDTMVPWAPVKRSS